MFVTPLDTVALVRSKQAAECAILNFLDAAGNGDSW